MIIGSRSCKVSVVHATTRSPAQKATQRRGPTPSRGESARVKTTQDSDRKARAMGDPADPITELAAAAVQLHEAYSAYVEAGFTEAQSFDLIKAILTAGMSSGPQT